jgi:hypothetical protein
MEDNLHTKI